MDAARRAFFRGRLPPPTDPVAQLTLAACLAQRGVDCRLCADPCEARAIRFVPRLGGVPLPQLDVQACTGCGDCVAACPVQALSMARRGV